MYRFSWNKYDPSEKRWNFTFHRPHPSPDVVSVESFRQASMTSSSICLTTLLLHYNCHQPCIYPHPKIILSSLWQHSMQTREIPKNTTEKMHTLLLCSCSKNALPSPRNNANQTWLDMLGTQFEHCPRGTWFLALMFDLSIGTMHNAQLLKPLLA